jgi:SulP family sulfate permease
MPLYFANAGYLEDMVLESIAKKPDLKYVILDMEPITIIDATGEEVLHALTTRLRDIGIDLLISRTKHQVQDVFDESGFTELLGKGNFFRTRNAAITFALNNLGIRNFEESPLNPDMSGYARGMTDRTI